MALLRIASGAAFSVDLIVGWLLALLPHLSKVCETDAHGGVCDGVSGGAGKAAEAMLASYFDVGN
ncbi:hypothetical protein [Paraburkholderia sp. J41]|uniref:hypothetical protein n=1 Tax=Paraburkholderia sp. J41 TaxID=2805433 RepID=UPI002AC3466B|nr:hypothetical protein [Paraburkholderia sp. J41]